MGFFLLGRGRTAGELRLISTEEYPGRSEAIEALTRLSGEPDFGHRDAEVFVLDLDTGMPVVLVAPAAPAAVASVVVEEPAEEPAAEPAPSEAVTDIGAGVWEAPVEPVEPIEPVEPAVVELVEPIEPAVAEAMEADAQAETVAVLEDVEQDEPVAEEASDLAGALKRAAGALESEGIVAPESIGPAQVAETAIDTDDIEAVLDQPWLAETGEPVAADTAPRSALDLEAEFEPVVTPMPEPVAEPEAAVESAVEPTPEPEPVTEPEPATEVAAEGEPEVAEGADASWPWDTAGATAAEVAVAEAAEEPAGAEGAEPVATAEPVASVEPASTFVPDPFEEPAPDPGDYLKVQIGDDSSAMGRTVVMGAYAEENEAGAEAAPLAQGDTEIDSMLADLGRVGDASGAPGSDLADLTCDDCVYVNTCPNKEELDPSKCGNFQWRSV